MPCLLLLAVHALLASSVLCLLSTVHPAPHWRSGKDLYVRAAEDIDAEEEQDRSTGSSKISLIASSGVCCTARSLVVYDSRFVLGHVVVTKAAAHPGLTFCPSFISRPSCSPAK
eukprot:1149360-Pelagomonas_calceolata.AAC.1